MIPDREEVPRVNIPCANLYVLFPLPNPWNKKPAVQFKHQRIQFSLPTRFLGGPGMLSRTSFASLDFLVMTSLSRNAVCMRRKSVWFLIQETVIQIRFGL